MGKQIHVNGSYLEVVNITGVLFYLGNFQISFNMKILILETEAYTYLG